MQLSPAKFNAFLDFIGQRYTWRPSFACPCVNPNSGAAKAGCPICSGQGHWWEPGIDGVAGMSGLKTQKEWAQFGLYENGDVVVTIQSSSPMYAIGQFDRVTAKDATNQFSIVLTHGSLAEKLFMTAKTITNVYWLSTDGTTIIQGGIPVVNPDGTLTWSSGAPPANTQYTISGTKYLDYYCFRDFPQNRNEHSGAALPKRVVLRDFDLFNRRT